MIKVSIIDDEPAMIEFFREATFSTSEVVCIQSAESVQAYLASPPKDSNKHFLFLDLHLGEHLSLQDIGLISEQLPKTEIIIYSVDEQYRHLLTAFKLGAVGYVIKNFRQPDLVNFFHILKDGGAAISPQMAKKLISGIREETAPVTKKLNSKEAEILNFLAAGWSYQYIADSMEMSVNGIRYYIKKIYKKLRVNSRAEAINIFRDLGNRE